MSLSRNVMANFMGQGIRATMGLAFVPLYIRYIGVESYGLIGLFAVVQSALGLLDLGMRPALGREMARFSAGAHTPHSIRVLLRSVESVGLAIALAVSLLVWAASGWLANDWVGETTLPRGQVANAFTIMGFVSALRFVENIYVSSIVGLQRQVLENTATALLSILRSVGALGVLVWIEPTIEAFFVWQGFVSLLTVAVFAFAVYLTIPRSSSPARFSREALLGVSRFASGMLGIAILSLIFMQMDKVLLSRLLSLEAFGYYSLAGVTAGTLGMLASPISTAFSPRLTELVSRDDQEALRDTYHRGAQLISVLVGSAAVVLAVFSPQIIMTWTNNPVLVAEVSPLVRLLAVGSAATYLTWIPYALQLAHGWTSLTLKVGCVFAPLLGAAIFVVVPLFGATGAAWLWIILNYLLLMVTVSLMHRRLMRGELLRWALEDVLWPVLAATVVALALRCLVPETNNRLLELVLLVLVSAAVLLAAGFAAPVTRRDILLRLPASLRSRFAGPDA